MKETLFDNLVFLIKQHIHIKCFEFDLHPNQSVLITFYKKRYIIISEFPESIIRSIVIFNNEM